MPLAIILTVSATKDLLEDLKRHKEDEKENFLPIITGQAKKYEKIPSRFIRVGNIVKIVKNQQVPCDLVLLKSSHRKGICYIET